MAQLPPIMFGFEGTILGSFFYGYIFTQLPGGWLATYLGGKWVFGIGILITSLLTIITPFAARQSVYLLVAVRIVEGIGEVNVLFVSFFVVMPILIMSVFKLLLFCK